MNIKLIKSPAIAIDCFSRNRPTLVTCEQGGQSGGNSQTSRVVFGGEYCLGHTE